MVINKWGAAAILLTGVLLTGCADESADDSSAQADEINPLEETVAAQEQDIKELEERLAALQETADSLELDLKYTKEEAALYREQLQSLTATLNESELAEFAKSQWTYGLTVNGEAVPANGQVELDGSTAKVTVVQKQAPFTVLPPEVFGKGKISGNFHEHVVETSQEPDDMIMTDGTVNSGVTYVFSDVPEGEELTVSLSEELKERTGLESAQLRISAGGE
ncbi:hypothetical protein [Indiicoccus explosivorum]|uniref:hypothetical protein n=1 Tax=Indiicoccus explosivorum TaxID=1917864 RepID=UPI000B43821E|nr:hypothetical protein [Indiicoccus explosivorum]